MMTTVKADGKKEYEDALAEYTDAQEEFDEKSKDAEKDIAEGKEKIADAEKDLAELDVPEWFVLDRNSIIMEIKYGSHLPAFLRKLTDVSSQQLSVSKYALCREQLGV